MANDVGKEMTLFFIVLLFICAYKAWVISPPCPHPLPYHPLCPSSPSPLNTLKFISTVTHHAGKSM
jgi:hypothetical protein